MIFNNKKNVRHIFKGITKKLGYVNWNGKTYKTVFEVFTMDFLKSVWSIYNFVEN